MPVDIQVSPLDFLPQVFLCLVSWFYFFLPNFIFNYEYVYICVDMYISAGICGGKSH